MNTYFKTNYPKLNQAVFLSLLFIVCSCGTTNTNSNFNNTNSTEQIFVADQTKGSGGKCYVRMKMGNELVWVQAICQKQLTRKLIKQIQSDLVRLGYEVDGDELSKSNYGRTTVKGVKAFQRKNNMAYGSIDWATINRLKAQ